MPGTTGNNNAIILRIEEKIDNFIESFNEFRVIYTGAHVTVDKKADAAHERITEVTKRIDCMEKEIENLKDSVKPLIIQSKILGWIAIGFGGSVIALIWALLTDAVKIVTVVP